MFEYPSVVSRTLDPTGKSLRTIVGLHDHELSDADINLIQDLQKYKTGLLLKDGPANSGCLTWSPLVFNTSIPNTFTIPQFDVLFNGEVVTVTGALVPSGQTPPATNQALNYAVLPPPAFWNQSQGDPAAVYCVFLELWYQSLDPSDGTGYYSFSTASPPATYNYFYPYGCFVPQPAYLESIPDDSVDIFNNGLYTTQRAQIQWRINVQRLALSYDFTQYRLGLDPFGTGVNQAVYAQAAQPSPVLSLGGSFYPFQNLGIVTGDTGLWRAGDGIPSNSLDTMDGYSYAMPLALVFQRNSGPFSLSNNIFGCAKSGVTNSGLIQYGISGRYDSRLADEIFPEDTVDTRQTVSLDGWDYEKLTDEGFVDLFTGSLRSAIGRGVSPGNNPSALGSAPNYYVSMAPSVIINTNTVGAFDGYMNGFSSDQRTFYTTLQVTINNKSVGQKGHAWTQGDAFTVPVSGSFIPAGFVTSVFVQGFNLNSQGVKVPINLLSGQVLITNLGTKSVNVSFPYSLSGTPFDPGAYNLYVTIGVTYAAGGKANLQVSPIAVDGGLLRDADPNAGRAGSIPVYGVSEYSIQAQQIAAQTQVFVWPGTGIPSAYQVWAYNPEYSGVQFGTRIWVQVAGSAGQVQSVAGSVTTTFNIPRLGINGSVNGLYIVSAWDLVSGNPYPIFSRTISNSNTTVVVISQAVVSSSTVVMSFMAQNTAQAAFNAPVKGITGIEETALFGTYLSNSSLTMDGRVVVESVSYDSGINVSTVVMGSKNCTIKGIAGDDINKLVWVTDPSGNLNAVQASVSFNNGLVTVTVPQVNLVSGGNKFLFVGSLLPAFNPSSVLTVEERYVPYQGEGALGRSYEVLYTSDTALITTNGTGAAPVIGLSDVFPYNRELPLSTVLPTQVGWPDSTLTNLPLSSVFDSNYVAMRQNDVETVFETPLHTNDFIPPMNRDIRKQIQLLQGGTGGRGFAKAIPHVGFAISPPSPRSVLGQNLQSTVAPIVLYVNNLTGNDSNDGLSLQAPKLTITGAVSVLPPVLRHPCSVQLVYTGTSYVINTQSSSTLQVIALGDGVVRTAKWYALANLAFSIQGEGRVVITSMANSTNPVVIDATGWAGFGDGPTSAFFVNSSRVLFNNLKFQGFVNPAVYGIDSDVEFIDCVFVNNAQAAGFEQGSGVIFTGGSVSLPTGGNGFVLSQSDLTVSGVAITVAAASPGSFFTGERSSSISLSLHAPVAGQESGVSATTVVAYAQLNSSISADSGFQTAGEAILTANSVLARNPTIDPFLGGINADSTSSVVTII